MPPERDSAVIALYAYGTDAILDRGESVSEPIFTSSHLSLSLKYDGSNSSVVLKVPLLSGYIVFGTSGAIEVPFIGTLYNLKITLVGDVIGVESWLIREPWKFMNWGTA
jgi:hemin uptake protein HemP